MQGNLAGVFAALADDVEYTVNSRDTVTAEAIPWSTTFHGKQQVEAFFERLMRNFDVLDFRLDKVLADGDTAAAFGHFKYRAKGTGKDCQTDWCARFTVRGGRISHYHFFEDSYAIARAFHVAGEWQLVVDGEARWVPG